MKLVLWELLFSHVLNFVTCKAKWIACLDIQRFMWLEEEKVPRWLSLMVNSTNQEGKKKKRREDSEKEIETHSYSIPSQPRCGGLQLSSFLALVHPVLWSKCTVPGKTNANVVTAGHSTSSYLESLDKWKEGLILVWRINGDIQQCYSVTNYYWTIHKRGVRYWCQHWGPSISHIHISIRI